MNLSKILAASVAGSVSAGAWAVDPQSINIWGFDFTPTLTVSESYDDNIRAFHDNTTSSWITSINPKFLLSAEDRNSAYQLEYSLNRDIYHSDSDATNTDHHLVLRSIMEFTSRHRLAWNVQYHRVEDVADDYYWMNDSPIEGDNDTQYLVQAEEENDKYSRAMAGAVYTFGAREAMNQLDFGVNYEARRYYNGGGINDDREFDSTQFNTIWYHRLGARTRTLLEGRYTNYDYKLSSAARDSKNYALLGGLTWDATAKTTGTVKLGAERKNFDSSNRSDYTTPMWEVGLAYSPRTYSTFKLNTRRAFDEGDDGASTIETQTTALGWTHEWSPFIRTELEYRIGDRDYKGVNRDGIKRSDDLTGYGAGITWSPDRWVDVTLGYRHLDNDSNIREDSYKRNIYQLSMELSL
jgi:hypothetical protein